MYRIVLLFSVIIFAKLSFQYQDRVFIATRIAKLSHTVTKQIFSAEMAVNMGTGEPCVIKCVHVMDVHVLRMAIALIAIMGIMHKPINAFLVQSIVMVKAIRVILRTDIVYKVVMLDIMGTSVNIHVLVIVRVAHHRSNAMFVIQATMVLIVR